MGDRNLASGVARHWAAVLVVLASLMMLIMWRERPPRPKPASAPATEFSADRAWPVLLHLTDTIGYRVAGTPGAGRAERYLVTLLREIPGVDVDVQEVSGARRAPGGGRVTAYTLRNIVARIPGRSRDALLLSAHYDTPPGSVGAGDDAVAVAALVEVVRALAAGAPLEHSIIVNINDGEEQGLLGAHGFIRHPWFSDVRAFVNLESAGPHGKAILFQAGVGGGWLISDYARSVPYPYGTVLAQDIFQSGAIPSDTDFRVYRDAGGLVGLDIALFRGGWAYHTQRDRPWNISRGTVQHMGENALALARSLAGGPLTPEAGGGSEREIFYDVLGAFMVHYDEGDARLFALVAIALGMAAIAVAMARGAFGGRTLAASFACVLASVLVGPAAALALGAGAAYGVGRPMSWFAHPAWATAAFAVAALAGVLAVQCLLVRLAGQRMGTRPRRQRASAVHGALVLFWISVLALLTLAGIGSAYIALWWVLGLAAGLIATALARGRVWWLWLLLGVLPAALLTLQIAVLLAMLFVPVFGRLPTGIAPDLILAVLIALPATALALSLAPVVHRAGALGRTSLGAAMLAVALMVVSLMQERYSERRPQRLVIMHVQRDTAASLRVHGMDYVTPERALARAPAMRPVPEQGSRPLAFALAAGPTGFPMPRLELLEERRDTAQGTRTLTFRARPEGASRLRILGPFDRVAGWSIPAELPSEAWEGRYTRLDYVAPPDSGIRFSLLVRGNERIRIHIEAQRFSTTPAAAQLLRVLPPWTDAYALARNGVWWREPDEIAPPAATSPTSPPP